jgi:hypothetical protein
MSKAENFCMLATLKRATLTLRKFILLVFVFLGLLSGKTTQSRASDTPSIPERIAAVQKSVQALPEAIREPLMFEAQWGNWANWANWNNWNNWGNWANWNNWNNWGNWANR